MAGGGGEAVQGEKLLARWSIVNETFSPTFAHGADEAPRLVRPAGDGAAAFDLVTPGTGDAHRLSDAEVRRGARPAAVVPPAGRRRAALGCKKERPDETGSPSKVRLC